MAVYNDGNLPTGSPVITINSVGYILNNWSVDDAAAVVNANDNNGEYSGAAIFRQPLTGSAELQCATTVSVLATTVSRTSTTGLFVYSHNGVSITWMITHAGQAKPAQGFWTQPIQFQGKQNA